MSSKYADEGTIAHVLAAMCLLEHSDAAAYIGRLLESHDYEHAKLSPSNAHRWMRCPGSHALEHASNIDFEERSFSMEVTEEMAEHVQVYVDAVRERVEARRLAGAVEVILLVEQPLPIGHLTGEDGATGTGDAVIVSVWEDGNAMLDLIDLKFGRGVEVEVEDNEQLQMYGLGALENLDLLYNFTRACLTVHQPRVKREPSDWEVDIDVLRRFAEHVKERAFHALQVKTKEAVETVHFHLTPGEKQCRFCKAKATCPKLREEVASTVFGVDNTATPDDFENLDETTLDKAVEAASMHDAPIADWLAAAMAKTDLIEDWCRAVRAEVERFLLAGTPVPGWKVVQGRAGSRAWTDAKAVEETFKSMRLKQDEMYDFKLISPTTAEKLLKDTPKRWSRVQPLISRSDGKPSVAPESDKRPALVITPIENDFDVVDDAQPNAAVVAAMDDAADLAG